MPAIPFVLPALRGYFGDWIYYACIMPLSEVAARVRYAKEVHPNVALSQLIQRSLEGARAAHIAEYLATKERFFNSLVLATYGGSPEWFEVGNFASTSKPSLIEQISVTAMDALGFLRLSGSEKIFAIDGQHRLAGIKKALSDGLDVANEQVSVLFVGHHRTPAGLQRTRRLFTTLNKTAIPVQKRDIIALDEDDVMAITARRLVETNPSFRDPKIAVIATANIPPMNRTCLTTIAGLYDVLKLIFEFKSGKRGDRSLRFNRPSDNRLDDYYSFAVDYFDALGRAFRPVSEVLAAKNPRLVTEKHRGSHGGHLLFRPLGLELFTRTAIDVAAARKIALCEAVSELRSLPTNLARPPYRGTIWDSGRSKMIVSGKSVARDVLLYMVGLKSRVPVAKVYARALGEPLTTVKLPRPLS